MDFFTLFRTPSSSTSLLDKNLPEIYLDPFQKALENKRTGNHFLALRYAEQAQQQGEVDNPLYLLGKQYQEEGNHIEAQTFFQKSAFDYAHPQSALELIKALYQDTFTNHAEIARLALIVVPKAGEEITSEDKENMLALGELYLENISLLSDQTERARQLLTKVLSKETKEMTVETIPAVYPKMKELAANFETPRAVNAQSLFTQANLHKNRGQHAHAIKCAELAQKNGDEDALFSLGKMYGTRSYARQCFSIAAHQYLHRQAALELIKILYEQTVPDYREIAALSLIVPPAAGKKVTDQDNFNMLVLGELYLENSSFLSDSTKHAEKLLTKIIPKDIPAAFPKMQNLKASLKTLPQQFVMTNFSSQKMDELTSIKTYFSTDEELQTHSPHH